mmetsp:Transcript_46194/g.147817  ORF Transcript_46194/g.147817 Transcript_46194/m.147817 type:complete len:340 (+) Transcript_46194:782-1801(+)
MLQPMDGGDVVEGEVQAAGVWHLVHVLEPEDVAGVQVEHHRLFKDLLARCILKELWGDLRIGHALCRLRAGLKTLVRHRTRWGRGWAPKQALWHRGIACYSIPRGTGPRARACAGECGRQQVDEVEVDAGGRTSEQALNTAHGTSGFSVAFKRVESTPPRPPAARPSLAPLRQRLQALLPVGRAAVPARVQCDEHKPHPLGEHRALQVGLHPALEHLLELDALEVIAHTHVPHHLLDEILHPGVAGLHCQNGGRLGVGSPPAHPRQLQGGVHDAQPGAAHLHLHSVQRPPREDLIDLRYPRALALDLQVQVDDGNRHARDVRLHRRPDKVAHSILIRVP